MDMLHVQSRGQSISLAQGLTQPPNSRLIAMLQESVDAPTYSEMEVLSLVPRRSSGYVHCMLISKVERMPSKTCNAHARNHCSFVHKYSSEL